MQIELICMVSTGYVTASVPLMQACVLHSSRRSVELVDQSLFGDFDRRQAVKILELAIKCINLAPTLRPTMTEVVSELEQIAGVPQHDLEVVKSV